MLLLQSPVLPRWKGSALRTEPQKKVGPEVHQRTVLFYVMQAAREVFPEAWKLHHLGGLRANGGPSGG